MKLVQFRAAALAQLNAATTAEPNANVHLLYSSELADPLGLAKEKRREQALIRPPSRWQMDEATWPRVVTLDCRRVASYLLETSTAFDDPLFEDSITRAHAEAFEGALPDPALLNSTQDATRHAVCGWIVSSESADTIAGRFSVHGRKQDPHKREHWLRWHDPRLIPHLWPTFSDAQRHLLLGERAVWFAPDARRGMRAYAGAPGQPEPSTPEEALAAPYVPFPSAEQWNRLTQVVPANHLLNQWAAQLEREGRDLPADALERIHRQLDEARRHGLDAEDMVFYAMLSLQLAPAATRDPMFERAVVRCKQAGVAVRDALADLPDEFWLRYGAAHPA